MTLPMTSTRPAHLSIRHPSELPTRRRYALDESDGSPIVPSSSTVPMNGSGLGAADSTRGSPSKLVGRDAHPSTSPNGRTDDARYEDDSYSPTELELEREARYPNLSNGQLYITSLSAFAFYFHPVSGVVREGHEGVSEGGRVAALGEEEHRPEQEHEDEDDRIGEEVYHLILDIRFVIGSDEWVAYEESCRDLGGMEAGRMKAGVDKVELGRGRAGGGLVSHSKTQGGRRDPSSSLSPSGRSLALPGRGSSASLSTMGASSNHTSPFASSSQPLPSFDSEFGPTRTTTTPAQRPRPIFLPNVYKITLFGAEHVEESRTRAEAIGEILGSCGIVRAGGRKDSALAGPSSVGAVGTGATRESHGLRDGRELRGYERSAAQSRRQSRADAFTSDAIHPRLSPIDIEGTSELGSNARSPLLTSGSYASPSAIDGFVSPPAFSPGDHSGTDGGGGGGFSAWGSGSRIESGTTSAHPHRWRDRRSGPGTGGGFGGGFGGFTGIEKSNGEAGGRDWMVHEGRTGLLDAGWREVAMYSEEARGPMEVEWLTSIDVPLSTLTFSTHLMHPAIIEAGKRWGQLGCLRKMAVRGGFVIPMKVEDPDGNGEDSWEASKPDYTFAMKDWISGNGLEILIWSFLGAYTETSTCAILKRLFDFLQTGFERGHRPCQTLIMEDLIPAVREKLLSKDPMTMSRVGISRSPIPYLQWLEDIILIEVRDEESGHVDMNRLWDTELSEEEDDQARVLRRFKSDMLANDHRTKRHPGLKARDGPMSIQEQCESLRFDVGPLPPPLIIDPGTPVPVMTPPLDPSERLSREEADADISPLPSRIPSGIFSASTSTASLLTCGGTERGSLPSPTIALGLLPPGFGEDTRAGRDDRPSLDHQSSMLEMKKGSLKSAPARLDEESR